ncbi:hypothetical protein ACLB2K_043710 [Fragaria x ananassa]
MASATPISALSLFFLLISSSAATATGKRRMVFCCNEVLYDGQHANRTILAGENHLGDMVAFNDPINLDNNVYSTTVHKASLSMARERYSLLGLASPSCSATPITGGSFNFCGADHLLRKAGDISVIEGTGDFFIARGIATLMSNTFQGKAYFRLRIDFNLYECW